MHSDRRFSLLPLPQLFDGSTLDLNIVVLPRNQNPLQKADGVNAPPFAQAKLTFAAKVGGLATYPDALAVTTTAPLATTAPTQAADLFAALAKQFDIKPNSDNHTSSLTSTDKATAAVDAQRSVQKYLPLSYRQAFNFTSPRTPNARTDDSYHCAVRNAGKVPNFQRSLDTISWGKVFAYALRQPLLATQLGMIYRTKLPSAAALFAQGGWLFIDLAAGSDYAAEQLATGGNFIKTYAARIPALTAGKARQVFAPLLLPVANAGDPAVPDGNYDQLLLEMAEYDDGFAKIIHAHQPHSLNLLSEHSDGAHPVKDLGIRLGWDDEQILIWYMRQMMIDLSVSDPDRRIDAPLGVFGYAVDVRETATPEKSWDSLSAVVSNGALTVPRDRSALPARISLGNFRGELPYQVYPSQLDGDQAKTYWLPMYFANWNGHSMVLPDQSAAAVYQTTDPSVEADLNGTSTPGPAPVQLSKTFSPGPIGTALRYGKRYEFRVRLRDLSGGGAINDPRVTPVNASPANVGRCHFKRYVAPVQVRVKGLPVNTDSASAPAQLVVRRPLLGYPAVVYTGKYADPIAALAQASKAMAGDEAFGIEDPDVDRIEITVEVGTLKMDSRLSVSGKDNYVFLYKTVRSFAPVHAEADYRTELKIPIVYKDCRVLHVGEDADVKTDLDLADEIDKLAEIVVPTARTVRLTLRAICEEKPDNSDYYGLVDTKNSDKDTRFGGVVHLQLYKDSTDETGLFVQTAAADKLRGILLQPDPPAVLDGNFLSILLGKEVAKPPDMVQRLAQALDLENSALSLMGRKGERVQFGCSNRIRHSLAPESSSLTFSSKADLTHHWLCCVTLIIDRDWTWNALEDRSFVVNRTVRFTHDGAAETETSEIGDIEIRRTASFEALQDAQRNFTRLVFIDAVEPKNERMRAHPNENEPRFPDTIEVSYSIAPKFKTGHGVLNDGNSTLNLRLPISVPPAQVPKLASAGIALSPYRRNDKYSATEPRQRYLWIEFEEAIKDPQDTYFARVLANAPDQLISNNHPELLVSPEKPPLPVDSELIRVIPPAATNDLAGLHAMQPMERATDSDRHYLLPIPAGLHPDAPEMFGFFTYEFRVGHYRDPAGGMAWSTALGRFGRPLEATGVQHPAPTLTCSVNRDEEKLYAVAPYAVAVHGGKNYTADPPHTQLWCLLYAQVRQADNQDFRNILLDDKQLDWRVQIETHKQVDWWSRYDSDERRTLKAVTIKNWKDDLNYGNFTHVYKLTDFTQMNKDATKYGTVVWSNAEVEQLLQLYGLPRTSPLSVLVVETLPTITKLSEHVSATASSAAASSAGTSGRFHEQLAMMNPAPQAGIAWTAFAEERSPLSDELGQHRILRTSPLTEVPFVC